MKRITELLEALAHDLARQGNGAGAVVCDHATNEINRLNRMVTDLLDAEEGDDD